MGIKIARDKPRHLLLTICYRLFNAIPILNGKKRLRLYLDLEWIFERLSHEMSYRLFSVDEHPIRQHSIDFMLRFIREEDTVLDLGCNMGDISNEIAKKAKAVVGIDHNRQAIELAQSHYQRPNLTFICDDALAFLQRNTAGFDVLVLSHIIEHLDDPFALLNNIKSYVKYIYIEVPDFDKSYHNHYRITVDSKLTYTDDDHIYEYSREELNQLAGNIGLELIESEYRFGVQRLWYKGTK